MARFRTWFEDFDTHVGLTAAQPLPENTKQKLQQIWHKLIQALGGASGKNILDQSISEIGEGTGRSGKKGMLDQLGKSGAINELKSLNVPELTASVEETVRWLGQEDQFRSVTLNVGEVLKRLLGGYYEGLANPKDHHADIRQKKAQPMPPPQPVVPTPPPQQPPPPMSNQPGV